MKHYEQQAAPKFTDRRNVTVQRGRIIWAPMTQNMPAGYVLPGGQRTQDEGEAWLAAAQIDKITRG